ncbi:HEAT-like repeat-containing protein [Desulfuromonas sp. DDH964]|nr:HEAT-like repeat-containing protein [Desulfuromonas sp. DDH964]
MSMNDGRPMKGPADEIRLKEELASATEVLWSLLKAAKAFRMYLPNNPLRQKFIQDSITKTTGHLERYGQCQFDVDQYTTSYLGTKIHESRDPRESIGFRLYADGIRSLIFSAGLQPAEICDFLDIVGQNRAADTDDDIVTLLWMKDLPNITYVLADDFNEVNAQQASFPADASQQPGIQRVYQTPVEPVVQPVAQPIQPLTAAEAAALKQETTAEESQDPLPEVMRILAAILAGEMGRGLFGDFLEITDNLIGSLLQEGRLGDALQLIRFLQKMAASDKVPPGKREMIRAGSGSGVTAEVVLSLQQPFDTLEDLSLDDLVDLFRYLGSRHTASICEVLGKVQKRKMRKNIITALAECGKDSPRSFYPFLRDKRWFLVRNILTILTLIGDQKCLGSVIALVDHPDPQVRKEVLGYLLKHPDPRARKEMLRFLDDESEPLRIRALGALAAAHWTPALPAIEAIIDEKEFAHRSIAEKCAFFEALGLLAGDSVVPKLRRMAIKTGWLNRSKQSEEVICAIAGLKKVRTPAALEALGKAQGKWQGSALEELIFQALKEYEQADAPPRDAGEAQ